MTFVYADLKINDWLDRSLRMDDLFTIEDVAARMRKSTDAIYAMRRRGELNFTRKGKSTFISRQNLVEYLEVVLTRTGLVDGINFVGITSKEEN